MSILDTARALQYEGFTPIPCHLSKDESGKRQAMISVKWKDDPQKVEGWKHFFEKQNSIAIKLGGNLRLQCLDVDSKNSSNPETLNSGIRNGLKYLPHGDAVYLEKTRSNGLHIIFRRESEVGSKFVPAKQEDMHGRIHPLIEVLGEGQMVFIAPSPEYTILQGAMDFDELPILSDDDFQQYINLCKTFDTLDQQDAMIEAGILPENHKKVDLNAEIGEGGRNNQLCSIAGILHHKGLDKETVRDMLQIYNETKCKPPLSRNEVNKIVESVSRYEQDSFEAQAKKIAEGPNPVDISGLLNKFRRKTVDDLYTEELGGGYSEVQPNVDEKLFELPNEGGDLMKFMMDSGFKTNKCLAFAGALVGCSAIIGRNFMASTSTRCNLEIVSLAGSGAGKDHPRKVVKELLLQLGLEKIICDDIATSEGLEDHLLRHQTVCAFLDEADQILESIRMNKTSDQALKLWNKRLNIYSASNSAYKTQSVSGKEAQIVHYPFFTALSSAIPTPFYKAMTEKIATKGFLGRCLILEAGKSEVCTNPRGPRPAAELVSKFKKWTDVKRDSNMIQEATGVIKPKLVPLDKDALNYYNKVITRNNDWCHEFDTKGQTAHAAGWGRVGENCIKLAMIRALLRCGPENASISIEDYQWAELIVEGQLRRNLWRFERHASSSEFNKLMMKMLERIKSKGGRQTKRKLMRYLKLKDRELSELIDSSEKSGYVITEIVNVTGGKQITVSVK